MYLVIFSISIALALPLVNCENTLSELNITASEGNFVTLKLLYPKILENLKKIQ